LAADDAMEDSMLPRGTKPRRRRARSPQLALPLAAAVVAAALAGCSDDAGAAGNRSDDAGL
jgi:hypothetical protein